MNWDWHFAAHIFPQLLSALVVTIEATVLGSVIALVLGLLLAIGRRSHRRVISWPIAMFVEFIRSTPLLVQLYFLFFVLPDLGIVLAPLTAGVIGLGLHYATYTSETYRAGIEGVPRGQWEAAKALNLSTRRTWTGVILPQAVPAVIPALGNYVNAMFKDSVLLSAITVIELLGKAQEIGALSFRYLEPYTEVGVLFLVLSLTAAILVRRLERHLARK
ncbi:MAG TPA: ectoine/hydroxyectoine ABC transporter permease subunit EhuD [Solirubrobacteraceae bacterium]|nr:ectoine/hydroxyectoine ABC transporter permease subunit EhuD [Solirubrobacteraceae bacterium]